MKSAANPQPAHGAPKRVCQAGKRSAVLSNLPPPHQHDFKGSLALHGGKAIIAADVTTVDGHTSQGKVYIFREQGSEWTLFDTLVSSDGTTDDFFGAALALGPDTVLVSTPHPVINGNSYQGAAYFFEHTPDSLP